MATKQLKKNPSRNRQEGPRASHLNLKNLGILAFGCLVLAILVVTLKFSSKAGIREAAIAQSKASMEKNEYDLALRHLDRYLAENPEDLQVIQAKADLLSKIAVTPDRVLAATQVLDLLIRLDPHGPERLATRRRLIELYIVYGEYVRATADELNDNSIEAANSRYLAAVEAAEELIRYKDPKTNIENGVIDAAAHRLKAMAYMGQVPGLVAKKAEDSKALYEAEKELDKALAIDQSDVTASEKLAELYMVHRTDPARAEKTLDQMLAAIDQKKFTDPKAAKEAALKVRISRFRAFYVSKEFSKAQRELEAALALSPENIELLSTSAALALQRHETQDCRRYLDRIPANEQRDNLRVRLIRGELEFAERHPDEAIDQWRKGLSLVGGGDQDLTWRLAANLIQFSRLVEAKPLVEQYLRLAKPGDARGLYLEALYAEKSGHINKAIELMTKASNLVTVSFKADVLMSLGHCYELIGEENKALYIYKEAAGLGGTAAGPRRAMARLYMATNPGRAIEELETAYSASKASGKSKLAPTEGSDVILIPSVDSTNSIPKDGKHQLILADVRGVLYLRFFDREGNKVFDANETMFKKKEGQVRDLREFLKPLWPPFKLAKSDRERIIASVGTLVEETSAEAKGDPNVLIELIRVKMDREMKRAKGDRNFSEISQLLTEAREIAPQNPAIQGLTAQYQSFNNRLDQAAKTLEETIKGTNRKRVESWLAYAEALELLGRKEDAIQVLDQGTAADAAGDHAALRANKARLLLRLGFGTRAKDVLTTNIDRIPAPERSELSKALGDLLMDLGEPTAARDAYLEWAKLAPESPFPALKLLSISQMSGDGAAAEAGLAALKNAGRDNEPYALAAQALQHLRTNPLKPGPPSREDLLEAERLVERLNEKAPDFSVKYMIQGMILEATAGQVEDAEWREKMTRAADCYRKSIKIGAPSPALPKLIEIYMKLKDNDKLNLLKVEYDDGTRRLKTEISMEFDRLSTLIAVKLGDKDRATKLLKDMVDGRPDNREIRFAQAHMLEANGKFKEAQESLVELTKLKPEDALTWFEWIRFVSVHGTRAEVTAAIDTSRQKYTGDRRELFVAQCYWSGKDYESATREFQKALAAKPDDLVTLRNIVEFRESINQNDQVDDLLRTILKYDTSSAWASQKLALRLSSRNDLDAWNEAWALVGPGKTRQGETPEDRLVRATVLARSTESVRRAEAIRAFSDLAHDLPLTSTVGIDARLRLSKAMLEINRPADAWEYVGPLCDDLSQINIFALVIGIECLARTNRGADAESRLNRLIVLKPNPIQIAVSSAWVYHALGKPEKAAETLFESFNTIENERMAEAIGRDYFELLMRFQDFKSSLILAQRLEKRWPRAAGYVARAQASNAGDPRRASEYRKEEYDAVLESCRRALDAGSARDAVQWATAGAIARANDPEFVKKAEAICEQGRNKAPNDHNILIFLATLRHVQGKNDPKKYEEELAFYKMAAEKKPTNCQFLNNMAWTLSEALKKPEEGLNSIEELIKRDGPAPQYLDTRGVIQTRLLNYDQAIADLERSVKDDPSPLTYYHLARAYFKASKFTESRRCREIALAKGFNADTLDPTDKWDVAEAMGTP